MTKQQRIESAEEFVRRVVTETFKQKIDAETVRVAAEKLARSVSVDTTEQTA